MHNKSISIVMLSLSFMFLSAMKPHFCERGMVSHTPFTKKDTQQLHMLYAEMNSYFRASKHFFGKHPLNKFINRLAVIDNQLSQKTVNKADEATILKVKTLYVILTDLSEVYLDMQDSLEDLIESSENLKTQS